MAVHTLLHAYEALTLTKKLQTNNSNWNRICIPLARYTMLGHKIIKNKSQIFLVKF
jgi:hypothetical protein